MGSSKALAFLFGLCQAVSHVAACRDYACWGVDVCSQGKTAGECAAPRECPSTVIKMINDVVQIRGWRCRVTLEQIRLAFPSALTKSGTEYMLNNKIWLRDGAVLEIHGPSQASSADTAVSLLKLKVCFGVCERQIAAQARQQQLPLWSTWVYSILGRTALASRISPYELSKVLSVLQCDDRFACRWSLYLLGALRPLLHDFVWRGESERTDGPYVCVVSKCRLCVCKNHPDVSKVPVQFVAFMPQVAFSPARACARGVRTTTYAFGSHPRTCVDDTA